jgi:23S rRNA (cytosine1962-C5)-methyltransferase
MRVTPAAERALRGGHPWVFADSIREANRSGQLGELAVIFDRNDRFLAIGLYDPDSALAVRVLHMGKPVQIDEAWWRSQWQKTRQGRESLFDERTTGYRCVYGESDGLPGLVLDRYGEAFVLKVYTAAWLPRLESIQAHLVEVFQPGGVVLRLSRNIQQLAHERFGIVDGQVLLGQLIRNPVTFLENGLCFEADVVRGQKTGFFLDQRENRQRVESLARGREVLNAFSFSGGFSLYAARGGACGATDIDISQHALDAARRNFALNRDSAGVRAARHEVVQADTFEWLEQNERRRFGMVILDPPSMARRETERAGAIQAYSRLAHRGSVLLEKSGILVAASCSAHVTAEEFFDTVRAAARQAGRQFEVMETTGHPPDHAARFSEANYLKCIYLRIS